MSNKKPLFPKPIARSRALAAANKKARHAARRPKSTTKTEKQKPTDFARAEAACSEVLATAALLGISISTLRLWAKGERDPSFTDAQQAAATELLTPLCDRALQAAIDVGLLPPPVEKWPANPNPRILTKEQSARRQALLNSIREDFAEEERWFQLDNWRLEWLIDHRESSTLRH